MWPEIVQDEKRKPAIITGDYGWDQVLAHIRLEARNRFKINDAYGHGDLLFLTRATVPEHSESLRLPQSGPDCPKDGSRESLSVNRSDIMLVHQAPSSLFGCPVVAAWLIKVQDLTPSHDCFGIFNGECCPLNHQCRLPDQGFPVDSLELTIANAVLFVE